MDKLASKIQKLTYTEHFYDPAEHEPAGRTVYEFNPSGIIDVSEYDSGDDVPFTDDYFLKPDEAGKLYEDVVRCMQTATTVTVFVDDTTAEAVLHFADGEITLPRGLGDGKKCLGDIITRYIARSLKKVAK